MSAVLSRLSDFRVTDLERQDRRPRVLVFEDDQSLCELYRELIEEVGFHALVSGRLLASCDDVMALGPSLILLDLFFRGEPIGPHFLTLLKSDPRTAAIPVVVVTGAHEAVNDLAPVLREWNCSVLLKPFDLDDLLGLILHSGPLVQHVAGHLAV